IAINKIHQLIGKEPKEPLDNCADNYNTIVVADIAEATEALLKGNPKFAEDGANDAVIEARGCENGFSGKSPLTAENNAMRDASAITAAIVRNLL
ncbi:cell wall/vacuolar inhibitor of fructosidase 1-like, partial [Trifolium medium]|nr:cell wall/vacuolar inhibitor of fructosidase 1-like [Trifolium medium]